MIAGIRSEALIATFFFLLVLTKADFNEKFLEEHNDYRALHGSPPLELDKSQLDECEKYAQHLAALKRLEHSTSEEYGENLCYTTKNPLACASMWYHEIKNYDFNHEGFSIDAAHFTQLIWKSSTSVAFGKAESGPGEHYVVARYFPPGNIAGEFAENVLRKSSSIRSSNLSKLATLLIWLLPVLLL